MKLNFSMATLVVVASLGFSAANGFFKKPSFEQDSGVEKGFEDLGMGYSRNTSEVRFFTTPLVGIDPVKFRKINSDPNDFGYRDDTHVFLGGELIQGADPNSFKYYDGGIYRDKKHLYWNKQILKNVDIDSFRFLGMQYGKDKNKVYQFGSQGGVSDRDLHTIEGADPKTFEVIPGAVGLSSVPSKEQLNSPDARDKAYEFRNGKILKKR